MRLRIRYAKRGRLRFTSHRDFSRAFERAVFRAQVPMAYSSGFNPHPRISYAGAAPTGSASEAEFLEIALAEVVDPAVIHEQLAEALPDGLDVLEVKVSPGRVALRPARGQPLADRPRPPRPSRSPPRSRRSSPPPPIEVERMTKKGLRTFDCRAAVVSMTSEPHERGSRIDVVVRHGVPSVRPDDVLHGMAAVGGLTPGEGVLLTRVAQGRLEDDGTVGDPLA